MGASSAAPNPEPARATTCALTVGNQRATDSIEIYPGIEVNTVAMFVGGCHSDIPLDPLLL